MFTYLSIININYFIIISRSNFIKIIYSLRFYENVIRYNLISERNMKKVTHYSINKGVMLKYMYICTFYTKNSYIFLLNVR